MVHLITAMMLASASTFIGIGLFDNRLWMIGLGEAIALLALLIR